MPLEAGQTPQVTPQVELMDKVAATIKFCETPGTLKEIMQFLKLKVRLIKI